MEGGTSEFEVETPDQCSHQSTNPNDDYLSRTMGSPVCSAGNISAQ